MGGKRRHWCEVFDVKWGLRHGEVVFPMLFNIGLERMVRGLLDTDERIKFKI